MNFQQKNNEIKKAARFHRAGRYQAAQEIFYKMLLNHPDDPAILNSLGMIAHQLGQYDKAKNLIEKAVNSSPDSPDLYNNLGLVLAGKGESQQAISSFRKAIQLRENYAEAYYNLGVTYRYLGRIEEAIETYEAAVKLDPENAEVHYNLGNVLRSCDKHDKAVKAYLEAVRINPDFGEAYNNLGIVLGSRGELESAVQHYREALRCRPDYPEAYNNLGHALQRLGRLQEAISVFQKAITLKPERSEYYYNLGVAFEAQGNYEKAAENFQQAIKIKPNFSAAYNNLGLSLKASGKFVKAIENYRKALRLDPDNPEILNNLGNALEKCGRYDEAAEELQRALFIQPDYPAAYNNLGVVENSRSCFDMAAGYFRKAMDLETDFPEAAFNLSVVNLLCGRFLEGWKLYESRFRKSDWKYIYPYHHDLPRWNGKAFPEKRLFVHDEQGFGDTLQFIRYLPLVKALGGSLIFETKKPLAMLLKGFPGIDHLLERSAEHKTKVEADMYIPLLSIPGIFRTDLATIPARVPYLSATQEKIAVWAKRLRKDGLKIGISWAGNPAHENDRNRSCSLKYFMSLARIPGVTLFGLQKGKAAEQTSEFSEVVAENIGDELHDFSETAAVLENLDLIISVDTALAHLAGAMARPVWTLLPKVPDWRWMLERSDSPWYPTMRLFRQEEPGDWTLVFKKLSEELAFLAAREKTNAFFNGNDPLTAEEWVKKGRIYQASGQPEAAIDAYRKAIQLRSDYIDAYLYLSDTLSLQGRADKAAKVLETLAGIFPDNEKIEYKQAAALKDKGDSDKAVAVLKQCIRRNPNNAEAHNLLGITLGMQNNMHAAFHAFDKAIRIKPDFAEVHNNRGVLFKKQGMADMAEKAFELAVRLKSDFADAHFNRSVMLLMKGNYEDGWKEYEWRRKKQSWKHLYPGWSEIPEWKGGSVEGKRIYVRYEQGMGDTIQFARYLPMLKKRGAEITLETWKSLHPLFRNFEYIDEIVDKEGWKKPPKGYDYYVHLLSLPGIFKTTLKTIPGNIPYIFADNQKTLYWKERTNSGDLKIGVVWAGNPAHKNDRNRSIGPGCFEQLAQLEGIKIYSLQTGKECGRIKDSPIVNLGEKITDFADTAGIVENLDLVISVDTSVAHLAGAMGKPIWVLLPYVADWRWLAKGSKSPWYPNMMLFRQKSIGEWPEVFSRVKNRISTLLESRES